MGRHEPVIEGTRYSHLVVIKRQGNSESGDALYLCRCECGKEKAFTASNLALGKSGSCGCQQMIAARLARSKPLHAGDVFGRLTVIVESRRGYYRCLCQCGRERVVWATHLRSGHTTSCGCARGDHSRTHGLSRCNEYRIWRGIHTRCLNPRSRAYARYGGRGITICDRWNHRFEPFYADMGPIPSPHHTIERRDNDGPYSPENCYWATRLEQANNKRNNRILTAFGRTQTLAQWARERGIKYSTLKQRLYAYGWTVDEALS